MPLLSAFLLALLATGSARSNDTVAHAKLARAGAGESRVEVDLSGDVDRVALASAFVPVAKDDGQYFVVHNGTPW